MVLAAEVGGRWSGETAQFLSALTKVRAQSVLLNFQGRMEVALLECSPGLQRSKVVCRLLVGPQSHARDRRRSALSARGSEGFQVRVSASLVCDWWDWYILLFFVLSGVFFFFKKKWATHDLPFCGHQCTVGIDRDTPTCLVCCPGLKSCCLWTWSKGGDRLRPISISANFDFGQFLDVNFWAPKGGGPEGWSPEGWRVGSKFRDFSSFFPQFSSFSLGVLAWNFGGVFEGWNLKCSRTKKLRVDRQLFERVLCKNSQF